MRRLPYYAQRVFPIMMCICMFIIMTATVIYMAKDNVFSNKLYAYFAITPRLHSFFMNLPVSKDILLRGINFSSICFSCIALIFPFILTIDHHKNPPVYLIWLVVIPFILQVLLFDPYIIKSLYFGKWGFLPDIYRFKAFYRIVQLLSHIINYTALGVGFILLLRLYFTTPRIPHIRLNIAAMVVGLFLLEAVYLYMFSWAPVQQLWMSRVAGLTIYQPLPVGKPRPMFNVYPLITLGIIILFGVGLYRFLHIKKRIEMMDWEFSRKVDMAETTVRAFCHYTKTEILAIHSEIENLQGTITSNKKDCEELFDRLYMMCNTVYDRLNHVHRMAGFRRICLSPILLCRLIEEIASQYKTNENLKIQLSFPENKMIVMGDEIYLIEVYNNLICNAIEAFSNNDRDKNIIEIKCFRNKGWVIVTITDNGPGIPKDQLNNIFEPFYSTKPLTTNWGIGLALCKRIILMHKGKLEVQSSTQGTTFTIALPNIYSTSNNN